MGQRTHTYNARACKISYAGMPLEDGLADGDFITVTRTSEAWTSVAGADGTVSRSRSNDERGEITVTFLQNSTENKKLQDHMNLDTKAQNGIPLAPFFFKDMISGDKFYAAEAWISNREDIARGKETGSQGWVFHCSKLEVTFGGL